MCVRCRKRKDKAQAIAARWIISDSGLVLCAECVRLDGQDNVELSPTLEGSATADIAEGAPMRVARREKVINGNN